MNNITDILEFCHEDYINNLSKPDTINESEIEIKNIDLLETVIYEEAINNPDILNLVLAHEAYCELLNEVAEEAPKNPNLLKKIGKSALAAGKDITSNVWQGTKGLGSAAWKSGKFIAKQTPGIAAGTGLGLAALSRANGGGDYLKGMTSDGTKTFLTKSAKGIGDDILSGLGSVKNTLFGSGWRTAATVAAATALLYLWGKLRNKGINKDKEILTKAKEGLVQAKKNGDEKAVAAFNKTISEINKNK